ncbi:unnamed protein product [Leptidea sinapis]|uniref:palmitoyl-protein hydrolase n=1 Tax=Leptidea sinapis TaxID=189913 RepID=A0A5E4QA87_9NEOP|nr:unnamed protein product [Leptidea sinapis]
MNGLSFSELCCLFCCPPCPGKIAAKLAFLPPEPTYAFTPDETGSKFSMTLTDRAEWQYSEREKENIEGFYSRTSRGNRIACLFVRCSPNARFTILFSHGNAVDLGQMSSFYLGLGTRINCNIFSYDYSGYGVSGGKPSEKNLYADIDAAWQALRTRYGISPENIILYGQSIGTVPTVDLAARYEVGAVVLHSPLMSGMRVAFPNTKRTWFFDAFPSIDKIPKVTSPVLVIHGTEDEVIDFSHGLAIYERCPRAVEPLWVEGAGHNDVELFNQYLERLKRFVSQAGAGPSRAGPKKNSLNGSSSPHNVDRIVDGKDTAKELRSPRPITHNISINITDTDSPVGVRRRIHLRSLSDVTPAGRSPGARARSHSEKPRASPSSSPSPRAVPSSPHSLAPSQHPRVVRSERSSPDASLNALSDEPRLRTEALTVINDPWRKMSEVDLKTASRSMRHNTRASLDSSKASDPWVRNPTSRGASRDNVSTSGRRRGKLERSSAVTCEACGVTGAACECWRPPCTCGPAPSRLSPRPPVRAHSDDEERPRRLYKTASQKNICTSMDRDTSAPVH